MTRTTIASFLGTIFVAALAALTPAAIAQVPPGGQSRVYRVRQTVRLDQIPQGTRQVRWWISIPDDAPAQEVLDFAVMASPGPWRIEREPERGNRFLYVEVANPDASS